MSIVGAGAVGVEFADVFNAFGTQVTLIDVLPVILPLEDGDCSVELAKSFKKRKIDVVTGAKISNVKIGKSSVTMTLESGGKSQPLEVEQVLVAAGRAPNIEDVGLKEAGVPHVQMVNYGNIPSATYCHPEVASVGLTEQQCKEKKLEFKVGKFPFSASGRARTSGETEGFVKIIRDTKYGEILGAHIIGSHATEILHELVVARANEFTVDEV